MKFVEVEYRPLPEKKSLQATTESIPLTQVGGGRSQLRDPEIGVADGSITY